MDSPEKVIPDNKGVASVMLRYFGDKAWFIVLERITGLQEGESTLYVPFWRGVLKALDEVKEEGK